MLQIRDILQVKFGKIDQAVALFTQLSPSLSSRIIQGQSFEVLTDVTGEMYNLINEFAVDSLDKLSSTRESQSGQFEYDEWFKQFQLCVEGGKRTFYQIEGSLTPWSRAGMIVVREAYRAYKWQVPNAVSLLQRYGGLLDYYGVGHNPRILTDASGSMFQAVIEIETESMSAWENQRRSLYREVEFQVWFNQMMTAVEAGSHEFYRVEYTNETNTAKD